jgi:hypothetical protein
MKRKQFLNYGVCGANSQAKRRGLLAGFAVLLIAAMFAIAGCGSADDGGGFIIGGPVTVTARDLTSLVVRPEAGEPPETTINEAQYTGTIAWKKYGGSALAENDVFALNTAYEALVTLTANTGYTFAGVPADSFTHYSGTGNVTNLAHSGTVTVTFAETKNLLYVGSSGTAETGTGTLAKAFAWLASNATDNTGYTIKLNANESSGPTILNGGSINGKTGVTITLTTEDSTPRTVQLSQKGSLFTVAGSGAPLNLAGSVVVKGRTDNNSPLIRVTGGGTLVLTGSAKITGNTTDIPYDNTGGSGVQIDGGTFNMTGGEISGNHIPYEGGGGVYVRGVFTMSGGTISGNTAAHGAGVFVRAPPGNTGTFTMSGGTISGNTATSVGGGVWVNARDDDDEELEGNGTFTMSDGTISGNAAAMGGGVGIMKANFNKTGGTISGNTASTLTVLSVSTTMGKAVLVVTSEDVSGLEGYRNANAGLGVDITITWDNTGNSYTDKTGLLND